jgi:hypothetical protein
MPTPGHRAADLEDVSSLNWELADGIVTQPDQDCVKMDMEKTSGQKKVKSRRHPTAAVHRRAASSGGGRVNVTTGRELCADWIGSPPESPFGATREAVFSRSDDWSYGGCGVNVRCS